jgi:hypothetical protein
MAGLDPAIPIKKAKPCHMIGIAGSNPAMTAGGSTQSEHALRCSGSRSLLPDGEETPDEIDFT